MPATRLGSAAALFGLMPPRVPLFPFPVASIAVSPLVSSKGSTRPGRIRTRSGPAMADLTADAERPTFQMLTSSISPWKNRPVPLPAAPMAQLPS